MPTMEFNWADPRKNSRVDTMMMAKAEASRVKRLTSIKSTLSNQLHPSTDHKLINKKKRGIDSRPSSRLHRREFDDGAQDDGERRVPPGTATGSSSCSNNHHHHHHNNNHSQHPPHKSFYTEFLPVATKQQQQQPPPLPSVFDSFDVHAAADGLFHPASSIQAFQEHDAKYSVADDDDNHGGCSPTRASDDDGVGDQHYGESAMGQRRPSTRATPSRTGGGDLLPPLTTKAPTSGGSNSSSSSSSRSTSHRRLVSRSEARLPSASILATTGLAQTRSDGDLHAPRRAGIVPSSADRESLETLLVGTQLEFDDGPSPVTMTTTTTAPEGVPALGFDLIQKFEALKVLMKTNRDHSSSSNNNNNGTSSGGGHGHGSDHHVDKPQQPPTDHRDRKSIAASSNKTDKTKKAKKHEARTDPRPRSPPRPTPVVTSQNATSMASSGKDDAATGVDEAPEPRTRTTKRPKKELKVRNGVSLSDLKEEHRAALAMLQELGGPIESPETTTTTTATTTTTTDGAKVRKSSVGPAATRKRDVSRRDNDDGHQSKTGANKREKARAAAGDTAPRSARRPTSGSRLVEMLRSKIPSSRGEVGAVAKNEELEGPALISAALGAARLVLDVPGGSSLEAASTVSSRLEVAPGNNEEEEEAEDVASWSRYDNEQEEAAQAEPAVDESDEEDPSLERYEDETFD